MTGFLLRVAHRGHLEIVLGCREEPGPAFGLVNPVLDQTGSGDVVMPVTNLVD